MAARSPIQTAPDGSRDAKSELFLMPVSGMYDERKFYEGAESGNRRFIELIRKVTAFDPDWVAEFLIWLRSKANIRTSAIVGVAEWANTVRQSRFSGSKYTVRHVVSAVLQRADEPGEFVAYWRKNVQRSLPGGVQRGVGDAIIRLYTERAYLKWDSQKSSYRFADVLNLVHPGDWASSAQKLLPWQRDLYAHIVGKAYNAETELPNTLTVLSQNALLRADDRPDAWLDAGRLKAAGVTWEDALSAVGSKVDKARLWTALAPSMGYMALLRNLRNFDQAGLPDAMAQRICDLLAAPEQVKSSRQLPFRFLSAHRAVPSLRWGAALERALNHSLENVPQLPGRTLIMVDTSGSMHQSFSEDGTLLRWDAAALFGIALGLRAQAAEVVSFSNSTKVFNLERGESLLRAVERWKNGGYFFGGGTATGPSITRHYKDHDRVVVLTDEQANIGGSYGVFSAVPAHRPTYTWNLAGYRRGHDQSGLRAANRHTFGGLTDQAFGLIPMLEAGSNAAWPWEQPTDQR